MLTFKVTSTPTLKTTLTNTAKLSGVVYTGKATYTLPIATASILGGVMIGSNINVTTTGIISVSSLTNSDILSILTK